MLNFIRGEAMKGKKADDLHMPRGVAKKILQRAARGEKAIVVLARNGKLTKVWGLDAYLKMRELPNRVKPWQHRKDQAATPNPLGAVDAEPPKDLTRENMYADED
jgi:hypothetical protein